MYNFIIRQLQSLLRAHHLKSGLEMGRFLSGLHSGFWSWLASGVKCGSYPGWGHRPVFSLPCHVCIRSRCHTWSVCLVQPELPRPLPNQLES